MNRTARAALAFVCLMGGVSACVPVPPPVIALTPVEKTALQGWGADDQSMALRAFRRSCERLPTQDVQVGSVSVSRAAWLARCDESAKIPSEDRQAAQRFFERGFLPYRVCGEGACEGLFTGYYETALNGALAPSARYRYPVYAMPDLSKEAMPSRAEIDGGALRGKGLEIAWVDDPVALFFLQVQGSGRLLLEDGSQRRLSYAGKNGKPYHAIGRTLREMGALTAESITAPMIMAWLHAHPEARDDVLHSNPSYVFFRLGEIEGDGPKGAQGVALMPMRSLAVDRSFYPYGLPFWLETELPPLLEGGASVPFRRLLIGQDTGSAITGAVRGDVFFGYGAPALEYAGKMQQQGTLTILLPKAEQ